MENKYIRPQKSLRERMADWPDLVCGTFFILCAAIAAYLFLFKLIPSLIQMDSTMRSEMAASLYVTFIESWWLW